MSEDNNKICSNCGADWNVYGNTYGYPSIGARHYCSRCKSMKAPREKSDNILIIPDLHIPFEHDKFLDFVHGIKLKYDVHDDNVYCVGDIVDNHSISFHGTDPNGYSPSEELLKVRERVYEWTQKFPKMKIAWGNHDRLGARQLREAGLPREYLREINEIYGMPSTWEWANEWQINDDTILYHGYGFSGKYPMANAAAQRMCNVIIGHTHTVAGVYWIVNEKAKIYGMSVGSGIDRNKYAFHYQREYARKPVVSCGVLLNGDTPIIEMMDM